MAIPLRTLPTALATAAALLALLPLPANASGENRHYTTPAGFAWFDIWWREQRSDHKTSLMLHFGQPAEHSWTRPGNARIAGTGNNGKNEDDLFEGGLNDMGSAAPDNPVGQMLSDLAKQTTQEFKQRQGRYRSQKAPDGKFYDYSPNRQVIDIPDGVERVANGRFGQAAKFTGSHGFPIVVGKKGGRETMDGWIKPTRLPDEPAWLFGSPRGIRLYLLPDGRLRLDFFPRGADERSSLTSDRALSVGEWVHVSCQNWLSNQRHPDPEVQLRIDTRVAAKYIVKQWAHKALHPLFPEQDVIHIGAAPDGTAGFVGLMDDIRITTYRRYNRLEDWPDFDLTEHPRPAPAGAPLFSGDSRVFHADFESRQLRIHPEGASEITWNLGEHAAFSDYQVDAPFGQALLVDPAMGFPRIPIQGMSPHKGTFELWFQPHNWDNNTMIGENKPPSHPMIRFKGRDKRNGKIVTFMTFHVPWVSMFGGKGWCQPGTWSHIAWSWSRKDVVETKHNWGDTQKGDPIRTFRGVVFGRTFWRAMLSREVDLIDHVEPLYMEIGIREDFSAYHHQRPAILVDEIIYHRESVDVENLKTATETWAKKHHPRRQGE